MCLTFNYKRDYMINSCDRRLIVVEFNQKRSILFLMVTPVSVLRPLLSLWSEVVSLPCKRVLTSRSSINMDTWPATFSGVISQHEPAAGWDSSLTFIQHCLLTTPSINLCAISSAGGAERRVPFPFSLYFLSSFYAWIRCDPRKLPSYFTNALGKILLSLNSVIMQ